MTEKMDRLSAAILAAARSPRLVTAGWSPAALAGIPPPVRAPQPTRSLVYLSSVAVLTDMLASIVATPWGASCAHRHANTTSFDALML